MKNILLITYYWRGAGGPGVQRWVGMSRYLVKWCDNLFVYHPLNPTHPLRDDDMGRDLPCSIVEFGKNIVEPYGVSSFFFKSKTRDMSSGIISSERKSVVEKFLLWIRGNFFIPDSRVLWVYPSVRFLKKYIKDNNIDIVITTGPPHSLHLIGMRLKKILPGVRWIADFRDPWTTIGYHAHLKLSYVAQKIHLLLERKVLQRADKIIVTSPSTKQEFETKTHRPIEVITNGFEPSKNNTTFEYEKFSLSHIGSLLSDRNPKMLWKALEELTQEIPTFEQNLQIVLAGKIAQEVLKDIEKCGLKNALKLLGYVSHGESRELQRKSAVLLLLEINQEKTKGIIPGKLFEYMESKRPILAMGYKKWDAAEIVEETKTGVVAQSDSVTDIKEKIKELYGMFMQKKLEVEGQGVDKFSREKLTEKLFKAIED